MHVPENKEVNDKVVEIIKLCLGESFYQESIDDIVDINRLLQYIISNSVTSINFLVLLEDEFDIEINDDDISLELFQSVENISTLICTYFHPQT